MTGVGLSRSIGAALATGLGQVVFTSDIGFAIAMGADWPTAIHLANLAGGLEVERLGVAPAVCITDSFGRAWRHGQVDVAIGLAGLDALQDWRGRTDAHGRALQATWIAVADQVAAAADLVRSKDAGTPAALVRGLGEHVTPGDGPGAAVLRRPPDEDLFL